MTVDEKIFKIHKEQEDGVQMKCPRCFENELNSDLYMNALSRRVNLYICSECGTAEAIANYFGFDDNVGDWAAFKECE